MSGAGSGTEVPPAAPTLERAHSASMTVDEVKTVTKWEVIARESDCLKDQSCCICTFDYADETGEDAKEPIVKLGSCENHYVHQTCIVQSFQHSNKCPVCFRMYGVRAGDQPEGTMDVSVGSSPKLSGYSCGTITINYNFPSGKQTERHPSPGSSFAGTSRTAYLPDNTEGREVLALLKRGFDLRHLFTIGTSVTTGRANCVIWNGVHHKTNTSGGPTRFGYPDKTYFDRVKLELAAKGIYPEDVKADLEAAAAGSGSGGGLLSRLFGK